MLWLVDTHLRKLKQWLLGKKYHLIIQSKKVHLFINSGFLLFFVFMEVDIKLYFE